MKAFVLKWVGSLIKKGKEVYKAIRAADELTSVALTVMAFGFLVLADVIQINNEESVGWVGFFLTIVVLIAHIYRRIRPSKV